MHFVLYFSRFCCMHLANLLLFYCCILFPILFFHASLNIRHAFPFIFFQVLLHAFGKFASILLLHFTSNSIFSMLLCCFSCLSHCPDASISHWYRMLTIISQQFFWVNYVKGCISFRSSVPECLLRLIAFLW